MNVKKVKKTLRSNRILIAKKLSSVKYREMRRKECIVVCMIKGGAESMYRFWQDRVRLWAAHAIGCF